MKNGCVLPFPFPVKIHYIFVSSSLQHFRFCRVLRGRRQHVLLLERGPGHARRGGGGHEAGAQVQRVEGQREHKEQSRGEQEVPVKEKVVTC